jgi:short subunit dehydrogenase-like uncharacterized protein
MTKSKAWILYGANGYTGQLIAELAKSRGQEPILAGRREDAVRPLAERLGLPWRVFSLEDAQALEHALEDVALILLCAGPFSKTSRSVVEACLATGTHYLDITGEIAVFEACHAQDARAKERGCVILPGVGFDVVPTDCLARSLKEALPDADHLELAFAGGGGVSRGTLKTMIEGFSQGGAIREKGRIRRVPLAWKTKEIPFRGKTRHAVSIPWGDVSTAYYSTGIPNIVTYVAAPRSMTRGLRLLRPFLPALGLGFVQRAAKRQIEKRVTGPSERVRETGRSHVWGRVTNAQGLSVEGTLETPEGYRLTAVASLECVRRLLEGGVAPGAHTPATAFGARFVTELEECDLRIN